jgi:chaperonin GroEL
MARQITEENKIETLAHIAKISLNGEEKMSKIIADAVAKTGVYGLIKVQENTLPVDELVTVKGLSFPAGYASPFFADRNDNKITLENCAVLITSHKLTNLHQMAALEQTLTHFAKKNIPVLFVASEVSGPFLTNLVANQKQGSLKNCALRPPYFGVVRKEFFTDLACLVDATIIEADEKMELDQVLPQHLGFAKRVEVNNLETTIIEGSGKKEVLAVRTQALQELASKVDKEQDLDKVHERLAKLTEGVMLIKIARESQVENEERKHRIEDALNACKAALEQGYVSGGGAALYYLFKHLDSKIPGQNLLIKALQYPAKKILSNAGFSDRELHPLEQGKSELTVNAKTGKQVDAYAEGIIDPVKVTKAALNNAISVAGVLLTTNVLISRIPEAPSPMPYQMY